MRAKNGCIGQVGVRSLKLFNQTSSFIGFSCIGQLGVRSLKLFDIVVRHVKVVVLAK